MTARMPNAVWSSLGPIPVELRKGFLQAENAFGEASFNTRTIVLDSTGAKATQVQTLYHEITHFALSDSGVQNILTDQQLESVCDAMGTFFANMAMAGCLTIRAPKG